jgi:transcriptional regulator with XRE-family HTH domain
MADKWEARREALGAFIREQRQQARLSLRQLAEMTSLSNPYLSQVERGLHQPSIRALKAISDALNLSAETLLAQAGLIDAIADRSATNTATGKASEDAAQVPETERAISADPRLSEDQKAALLTVYRSMVSPGASPAPSSPATSSPGASAPGASPSGASPSGNI